VDGSPAAVVRERGAGFQRKDSKGAKNIKFCRARSVIRANCVCPREGPGAVPAGAPCCFRYWEKWSGGEAEFFAIFIFIFVIDAQLAFVSFEGGGDVGLWGRDFQRKDNKGAKNTKVL
jgi:hypothetical protein